jgi:hypothetical protein
MAKGLSDALIAPWLVVEVGTLRLLPDRDSVYRMVLGTPWMAKNVSITLDLWGPE